MRPSKSTFPGAHGDRRHGRADVRPHRFLLSIHFSDQSNTPLAIATFDASDPVRDGYDCSTWFGDTEPVPALVDHEQPDNEWEEHR